MTVMMTTAMMTMTAATPSSGPLHAAGNAPQLAGMGAGVRP